jgi:multidrug efflux pump subunit AcrA (membrane-fusion protein)
MSIPKKSWLIIIVAVVLVVAGGAAYFWPFGSRNVLRLSGIVEIQEVRLGSKIGGRVEKLLVREGDIVEAGRPLIVFEAPELKNQRAQVKAKLDQAQAELDKAEAGPRREEKEAAYAAMRSAKARYDRVEYGWRQEEKDQAKSELDSAMADFEQSVKDHGRIAQLWRQNSVARSDYDAAIAYRDRSKGRVDNARAKVEMMKAGSRQEDKDEALADYLKAKANWELLDNGTRQEDKDLARAKVTQLKADLEAIDINLKETTIVVPSELGKAVVEVISVREGDLVPASQAVVRVLRARDLWVKVFVPETQYGLVTLGKEVDVTIDSHPGKIFKGTIIQRSNISEFTPRNVQSVDERRHQVFGVKVLVSDPQGVLNAGMAAEVTVPLQ